MAELLLEVGTEELPASFVRQAYTDLADKLSAALAEAKLLENPAVTALGTPRRLIVSNTGVKARQEDSVKEVRGPAVKGAFGADGNPTPALIGFCRGQGVEPNSVRTEGDYVWITKAVPGQSASEILAVQLPAVIRSLSFEKSMRWGSSRMRFARPIRWLLALLDSEVVPFEIESVASGNKSRGHRFYAPEEFSVQNFEHLISELRTRKVEPDPAVRENIIRTGAESVAAGMPEITGSLLEENVFLTEWPTAIQGTYPESFMELPEAVLVTAMAKHERMFPVRNIDGSLTNHFVFIRNSGEDDTVRRGSEWVLNARFNDAKFFFDEDKKSSLDHFLEKTSSIVFSEKLGTVRQRADRLANLAAAIAARTPVPGGVDDEVEWARQAGRYAKADLSTGLVSELSSLQGIVGGQYARREGTRGEVAWAIETQYDYSGNDHPHQCKAERTSFRLVMADQLDKLAGYLGIGLAPTGSSDPFGLRRAVTILIDVAWRWPGSLPDFDSLLDLGLAEYADQGFSLDNAAAHALLWDIFEGRYEALLTDIRHDIRDAATARPERHELTVPQAVRFRADVLTKLARDEKFVQTATRPLNLVASALKKGFAIGSIEDVTDAALADPNGTALKAIVNGLWESVHVAERHLNADQLTALLRQLEQPINTFIDGAMIMTDNESERFARLSLLRAVGTLLLTAGDFTRITG
jgi:glycyl-tRNA synthetase beta chain